jgi:HD domain
MSLWPHRVQPTLGGMSSTLDTTIAGVAIPDSSLARDATALVRDIESDLLYHHSLRVFVFGSLQGRRRGLVYDPELLYIGAMFHDVGLVEGHRSAHDRFEVDGANAARDFMAQRGVPVDDVRVVWDAIALHTTPGIPEHKEAEVALVNAGVALDVLGVGYESLTEGERAEVLAALPRLDFKHRIIEAFGAGMAHKPETTFGTMNADVLERTLPGYRRSNFCELILASPFNE